MPSTLPVVTVHLLKSCRQDILFRSPFCITNQRKYSQRSSIRHSVQSNVAIRFCLESKQQNEELVHSRTTPTEDVVSYILRNICRWKNKTALECGTTGRSYTYDTFYNGVLRLGALIKIIKESNRSKTVSIISPNSPEIPIILCGALQASAVVCPLNPESSISDILRQVTRNGSSIVIIDETLEPMADVMYSHLKKNFRFPALLVNGKSKAFLDLRDIMTYEDAISFCAPQKVDLNSDALIMPSSGTSDFPKDLYISHRSLALAVDVLNRSSSFPVSPAEGTYITLCGELFLAFFYPKEVTKTPYWEIFQLTILMVSIE